MHVGLIKAQLYIKDDDDEGDNYRECVIIAVIQEAKNSLPGDDVGGHSALQYVIIGRQRVRLWQWVCNGPRQTLYLAIILL